MLITKGGLQDYDVSRKTRRVTTINAPGATPTFNTDLCDVLSLTGLNTAITSMTSGMTGTPRAGDTLRIEFTDVSVAETIAWGAGFEGSFSQYPLPVTTISTVKLTTDFVWNPATSKWRLVNVSGCAVLPRATTVTSTATPTPNADFTDVYTITALAVGATFTIAGNSLGEGELMLIRVKDNGSPQTLAYASPFRFPNTMFPQPTTTVASTTLYMQFRFNSADLKWDCVWHSVPTVLPLFTLPTWTAATSYAANQQVILPTGGLAYQTATRTTRGSFDATERAFWTFIPGAHQEQIAQGTTAWIAPTGITNLRNLDLLGAGAGGNGGGSSTTSITQVGGPGGACGERVVRRNLTVVPTTSYTVAVGAGGTGGNGGAASGNNAGVAGIKGGDTTFAISGVTYLASGGNVGNPPVGGSIATVAAGNAGGAAGAFVSQFGVPGSGGVAFQTVGLPPYPLGGVVGGAAGGPASTGTVKGGLGGSAKTAPNTVVASTGAGGSGTTSGGNGTTATELGCGGGGGGGGISNGAGGVGGNGANGLIVVEF